MTRVKGAKGVGRIVIDFEVANFGELYKAERGELEASMVRRFIMTGVVDSGAMRLVLPQGVVNRLGLTATGKIKVRYADGRSALRDTVNGVYLGILGRYSTFTAVIEPRRRTALIGAIVLEDLDLLVDCIRQRVVPRDPRHAIYEIE